MKKKEDILETLTKRREKLNIIACSDYPMDPKLAKVHENRVFNAKNYVEELDSLISALSLAETTIHIVPENIFEKKLAIADYATIEDEGFYFRMAHVTSFPSEAFILLYLVPISSI